MGRFCVDHSDECRPFECVIADIHESSGPDQVDHFGHRVQTLFSRFRIAPMNGANVFVVGVA